MRVFSDRANLIAYLCYAVCTWVKINPATADFPHALEQLLILWHTSLQSMHVLIIMFNHGRTIGES